MNNFKKKLVCFTVFLFILFAPIIISNENSDVTNEFNEHNNENLHYKGNTGNEILNDFHDYATLTTELQQLAADFPNITRLYDLGKSVQGRSIWGLKITDNPTIEEVEPEIRICGCHHGDEEMSVELPLLLAKQLLNNYTTNNTIGNLVDTREIWIIPLVNPDGRMASPYPRRQNANNVDLNRDYGYMWDGSGGSSAPFSQPETRIIRENALNNSFVFSLSFHTTAAYVNYLWNYKPDPTPDDDVVVNVSQNYASTSGYTAIRGWNWYQTRGDTNDFSYGCRGDIDTTIETGNSDISLSWNKNKKGMIDTIIAAKMGLHGVVTDSTTGEPIPATIWVEEAYWPCFADMSVGDYHKPLLPGNYTVHYRANGYKEKIKNVEITNNESWHFLNISLEPGGENFGYQITWCDFYDPYLYPQQNFQNNPSEAISALGKPDNQSASLGVGGEIVIDMGETTPIVNGPGFDFIIYESDAMSERYDVYVAQTWNDTYTFIGSGNGTTSFLLPNATNHFQFVKIRDDGDSDPYEFYPGFDLDAIETLHTLNTSYIICNLTVKWNFLSTPFNKTISLSDLLVEKNETIYSWNQATNMSNNLIDPNVFGWDATNQTYKQVQTLSPGNGYWVYSYTSSILIAPNISSRQTNYVTKNLIEWNMIGNPHSSSISVSDLLFYVNETWYSWTEVINTSNGPIIDSNIFSWDSGNQTYMSSMNLNPGQAYWIYSFKNHSIFQQ